MPRRLAINDQVVGHVMTDEDVNVFTGLQQQLVISQETVARSEGRVAQLERNSALHNEQLSIVLERIARLTSTPLAAAPVPVPAATPVPGPVATNTSPAQPVVAAGPVGTGPAVVAGTPSVSAAASAATMEQLRVALQSYSRTHGIENARSIIATFGVRAIGQIPEARRAEALAAINRAITLPAAAVAAV